MSSPDAAVPRRRWPLAALTDSVAARRLWRVNRVYWLTVFYGGVWAIWQTRGAGRWAIFGVFLVAIVSLGLRTRIALQRGGYGRAHPSRIGWIFTALDLCALAAAIRLTGGLNSGLWPILFVIVVAETVLEPTREAWFVRAGAAVALAVACVPLPLHFGVYLIDLATRLIFLLSVTTVARRLREGSDTEKSEIAALRAELAMAEERAHLTREIHDGVGNSLASAVLRLEVAAREQERGISGAPLPELLREEAGVLRQAMSAVRDWTFWTRPWSTNDSATGSASAFAVRLTDEVSRLSRRTGIPIEVRGADLLDEPALTAPNAAALRLTLFRITQEALTNVAKHATGAAVARVALSREGSSVLLTIADDGPGLSAPNAASGVGLVGMRERTEGMGGTLTVTRGIEGRGVGIAARLPLP